MRTVLSIAFACVVMACGVTPDVPDVFGGDGESETKGNYPSGPVTGKYSGESWTMKGGEARIVDGMDEGTKQIEIFLWSDDQGSCGSSKHSVKGKEVSIVVPHSATETHIVGVNPDGSMVTFQYVSGSTIGTEFGLESYVLISSMEGDKVTGKIVSKVDDSYTVAGEFSVPLCK